MDSRLLVAAHIKRRSWCTDSEKRDIENIGMLNCKFGCDELYERGFVSVDANWSVVVAPSLTDDTALAYVRDKMRTSIAPRPASVTYFAWHRQHHNFE
jgi:predicted restriction endonuclease